MKANSVIDGKGKVRIPLEIREKMNLQAGEKVMLKIEDDKLIIVKTLTPNEFIETAKEFRSDVSKVTSGPLPPVKKLFD